ncbi:MAG: NAD-binding protein, partial [Candidatus Adiutrix sp.]
VIEMSSLAPTTAQEIAAGLSRRHINFMDAPVSGGEPKAIDGTLAIMAGGLASDFERAKAIFAPMAKAVTHVGAVGAGCVAKLANQIMVAANLAGVAEAFTLAAKAGVDPALVFEATKGGLAGSAVLEAKAPMMLDRNYTPGARLEIHIKDLINVLETAHALGAPTPLTAQIMEMMQTLKAHGLGDIDHSGLVRYFEMLAQVQVKRG